MLLGLLPRGGAAEPDHTTYIVRTDARDAASLRAIEEAGGVIDHYDGGDTRVYVLHTHWGAFRALGIPYTVESVQPDPDKQVNSYPSYTELTAYLENIAAANPELCQLSSIGQSVQGRELWALKITDQPDVEEDEPEFAYLSTLHGDETIGTILCLNFIELLLQGHGQDTAITNLVNETEIWILPLMNPDGYEAGIRWNANNADLNRSFPQWPIHFEGTIATDALPNLNDWEPEVARIMEWTFGQSLVLCANYHSGALVVNYPYDEIPGIPSGIEAPTPDDPLMAFMASAYASRNPPMFASSAFPGGITNGSAWFRISGGLQDWHYRFTGAIDFTLEVSNTKNPRESDLQDLWVDNRASMLAYANLVHRGIRGRITDGATGAPLFATVTVGDNPQPVFTDPDVGDYYRLVLPGSHRVRANAPGYIPFAATNISTGGDSATRVDITLSDGDINGDSRVDALDLQLVVNAVLGRVDNPAADVDGQGVSATDVQHLVNRVLLRP